MKNDVFFKKLRVFFKITYFLLTNQIAGKNYVFSAYISNGQEGGWYGDVANDCERSSKNYSYFCKAKRAYERNSAWQYIRYFTINLINLIE